jgi:hypothetical protein
VYLIVCKWLYHRLQPVDEEDWGEIFVCYDNMCNLNALKAFREDIPIDEPYNRMWKGVSKIIDGLHIKNHVRDDCKIVYNPAIFRERFPEKTSTNTMVAEQTFSKLSKYKKQLNAMTKPNQLFFLHRLCTKLNEYTHKCLSAGKTPVAPQARSNIQRSPV